MSNLNLMLGAKFELLGTNLSASYKKEGENYEILVAPNTLEKNNGVSIEEMISQVNALINGVDASAPQISSEEIENQIKSSNDSASNGIDIKKLRVILDMAYLYIKSEKAPGAAAADKTIEYAFSLVIDAKEVIPQDITFINIDSVTLAVWSTNRSKVIEKMALFNPNEYVKQLN